MHMRCRILIGFDQMPICWSRDHSRISLNNLTSPSFFFCQKKKKTFVLLHAANPNPPAAKPVSPPATPPCLVCGAKATPQPAKPASARSSFIHVGSSLGYLITACYHRNPKS